MQKPIEPLIGYTFEPRLRVFAGRQLVIGTGKIMMLKLIETTGSISEAARQMSISYNHAWTMLRLMNNTFREPLVEKTRGGKEKGGAKLTETGKEVLALYGQMVEESARAIESQWQRLQDLLRDVSELPQEADPLEDD